MINTKSKRDAMQRLATELLAPVINGKRTRIKINDDGSVRYEHITRKTYPHTAYLIAGAQ